MSLIIHNTLTNQRETFVPHTPGQVKMYCCGPTVYDYLHVGNFRGAVFYNFVRNWLEQLGYQVTFAYNFTDIDDKIINRAKQEGTTPEQIVETYIQAFWDDFKSLKLRPHDINPRVTESLDAIFDVIQGLIRNDKAYVVDGEVFYAVTSFKDYGKLSNRKLDDLESGHRIEADPKKQNPLDFTLWKPAKEGEISWSSPWGEGRPGWHIECTAMIFKHLGESIDIHGGGLDLVFPHHENEIAQAEGCTHKPYAKYWIHNNMFTFDGAKMSKSLGNIRTMKSFLEEYPGEVFKFLTLSSHYRSQTEFSQKTIVNSITGLCRIYEALKSAAIFVNSNKGGQSGEESQKFITSLEHTRQSITESFNDDFNTAKAVASIFELVRTYNSACPAGSKMTPEKVQISKDFIGFIHEMGTLLSLFQEPAEEFLKNMDLILAQKLKLDVHEIQDLLTKRVELKKAKNFTEADKLRDDLNQKGILIRDGVDGSTWEINKQMFLELYNKL
ncbi:MAG: cysteine--tRNA ligase [Bdellovibrionaceae bacterium]|nr:cysteine--tRNA ligase [Pseudobdellovibrionaceae bacterium]